MIVCLTPPQMNDFCDLLGTPDAPVSKIASVKVSSAQIAQFFFAKADATVIILST